MPFSSCVTNSKQPTFPTLRSLSQLLTPCRLGSECQVSVTVRISWIVARISTWTPISSPCDFQWKNSDMNHKAPGRRQNLLQSKRHQGGQQTVAKETGDWTYTPGRLDVASTTPRTKPWHSFEAFVLFHGGRSLWTGLL